MKSIRVPGRIDENDRLILDESLDMLKPQQVEIDIWFMDEDEDDEYYPPTKEEIIEGFRESLGDLLAGRTTPVENMWDDLMIQTTGAIDDEGRLILDEPIAAVKSRDVDVVIWFIRNRTSAPEVSESIGQEDRQVESRELIGSDV